MGVDSFFDKRSLVIESTVARVLICLNGVIFEFDMRVELDLVKFFFAGCIFDLPLLTSAQITNLCDGVIYLPLCVETAV